MDTCALTWFAKLGTSLAELSAVRAVYHLVIPTTVLYELAFGVAGAAEEAEIQLRGSLFERARSAQPHEIELWRRENSLPAGGFTVVNPGFDEWWAARDRVLKYVELANVKTGKSKQRLSMDALIHACARNCFSPVCTHNIDDFKKLNLASSTRHFDGVVPVFSPQQMIDSLSSPVEFIVEA